MNAHDEREKDSQIPEYACIHLNNTRFRDNFLQTDLIYKGKLLGENIR